MNRATLPGPSHKPWILGFAFQAIGLGRQGTRVGNPVQTGKVVGGWVRSLESTEAVSVGLALTQDVRIWPLDESGPQSQRGQGPEEGASQRLSEPREAAQVPRAQQPLNFTPGP